MLQRITGLPGARTLLAAAVVAVALSACGSSGGSGGDANNLLKRTFSGTHTVNSGNLSFSLTVNPSGSRTLNGPITLSFGGPFQSRGKGNLPASNFNISVTAQGRTGSLGLLSTGTNGYVTLAGSSYRLPASTFQKLESSFAQVASSPGASAGSGTLSKLGIDPLHWLIRPSIVGRESVGGADTTHIRARVDVDALLADVNTFLGKASSLGVAGATQIPSSISDASRNRIAGEVQNPTVDVWTGASDKTVRKLSIELTLPVSGQASTLLGGMRSAQIGLSLQYANLNQPQTIQAPSRIRPFGEFTTKLRSFLATVQSAAATGSAGSTVGSASTAASLQRYTDCVKNAGTDGVKLQRCAKLLGGQ